jgi:hypothetical protein
VKLLLLGPEEKKYGTNGMDLLHVDGKQGKVYKMTAKFSYA